MSNRRAYPLPYWLLAALIVGFSLAWGLTSAWATIENGPRDSVYVASPWPGSLKPVGGGCLASGVALVGVNESSRLPSTYIYLGASGSGRMLELSSFRGESACLRNGEVVIAGSLDGEASVAVVSLASGAVEYLTVKGVEGSSFNVVRCARSGFAAAGFSPEGIVVLIDSGGLARAGLVRYLLPVYGVALGGPDGATAYVLTTDAIIEYSPANATWALEVKSGLGNATWHSIAEGPGGTWLVGTAWLGGVAGAALAPLSGGRGYLVYSDGHGGLALDAHWEGDRWLLYYRPGTFWDALASLRPGRVPLVGGAMLLWSGSHSVEEALFDREGRALTITLSTSPRGSRYVVVACIGSLTPAHYWLGNESIMHIDRVPEPDSFHVKTISVPRPHAIIVRASPLGIEAREARALWEPAAIRVGAADLRWAGPLWAVTYIALSLVLLAALWRGFAYG
ncbi:MAG: hypothetical protein GSR80_001187 [Desulfurococcales archaeon]|nr:hypothetical protein [Desulfurococcales archaeon]